MKSGWVVVLLVFVSGCFSLTVHKIDQRAITNFEHTQAAARRSTRHVTKVCEADFKAINRAHDSLRANDKLGARIAEDSVKAIDYALDHNLIPDSIKAYYIGARVRQVDNRNRYQALARHVENVKTIC